MSLVVSIHSKQRFSRILFDMANETPTVVLNSAIKLTHWNVTCSHDYETFSMQLILVIILRYTF